MQQAQNIQEQASNKQFLRDIVNHDFTLPENIDSFEFAKALLANLGSTDSELRDELSYMILARGLIGKQLLPVPQMEELLLICLDQDHLFYHIGEPGTDAIFMRSFSNLIIAALLYADATKTPDEPQEKDVSEMPEAQVKEAGNLEKAQEAPVKQDAWLVRFSGETIGKTKEALLRYAHEERDWRGRVQGKGWAHAMAHLADSLDECAQNISVTQDDRKQILETIRDLAKTRVPLYDEEDVRLATVAYHIIICKQLDDPTISAWLESCYVERKEDLASWTSLNNAKNFLRSLYFLLLWENIGVHFADQISRILKRIDAVYIEGNDISV